MESSTQEKYLGDVIDKSGKSKIDIEKRKSKGYGIISDILAIINEIPLRRGSNKKKTTKFWTSVQSGSSLPT